MKKIAMIGLSTGLIFGMMLFFFVKGVRAQDNETKFNGNFPAKQIRELWQVCSFTFQQRHPQLPQPLRWLVCDCYTDIIRRDMTPESAARSNPVEAKDLTVTLINECNGLMGAPEIQT